MTPTKKYVWLNGSVQNEPDPDWSEKKALEKGIIPPRARGGQPQVVHSSDRKGVDLDEIRKNSLGSLAWDRSGIE